MQEQTTFPALLAIETMPAPVALNSPSHKPTAPQKTARPRGVLLILGLALLIWVLKRDW